MRLILILILVLSAAACGTDAPPTTEAELSLFPVAVGDRWEYRVTDGAEITIKTQTVTGTAADGSFVFVSENQDQRTESLQYFEGTKLYRASELTIEARMITD